MLKDLERWVTIDGELVTCFLSGFCTVNLGERDRWFTTYKQLCCLCIFRLQAFTMPAPGDKINFLLTAS